MIIFIYLDKRNVLIRFKNYCCFTKHKLKKIYFDYNKLCIRLFIKFLLNYKKIKKNKIIIIPNDFFINVSFLIQFSKSNH